MHTINSKHGTIECDRMRHLSNAYSCCGLKGPQDFVNTTSRVNCCAQNNAITPQRGCGGQIAVDVISDYAIYLIVIPTVLVWLVEFVSIIGAPFVIKHLYVAGQVYFRIYDEIEEN
jgi:hypothetical protein